ncbi:Fe-S cluster assembly protein SufB, partial [Candidatus Micrarchaeota archaeon]|nr:Fe-S cluster assembly protein SufB [Candidatus Micrarchaeota archaeon]
MTEQLLVGDYKYGFKDDVEYKFKTAKGINPEIVRIISKIKNEPEWMTEFRLKSYETFMKKPMPNWGADLSEIKFDEIIYYARLSDNKEKNWGDVPDKIKETFDKIGIPEAERKFLAGASAQYDSEVIYHNIRKEWEDQGVLFTDMDTALQKYPEIVKKYFGTIIPYTDNKFAALNSAVWSGGSFIYVPKGVHVKIPLQAYFRINAENVGQFERTLIIADEGSSVHYIEGCSAPIYTAGSLHSAVVELIAFKNSRIRYTTIQNWSNNVFNLVTKRGVAYENATVEWVDGNIGSKVTMKYPCVILKEPGAKADILSVAYAGKGQHQDAGGKVVHLAPNTSSTIVSK